MKTTKESSKIIIYDSTAYSTNPFDFNLIKESVFDFPSSFSQEKLLILKNNLKNPKYKKVELYLPIENFEKRKKEILEKIALKKAETLNEEDYELIPAYSQKELIKSMIESISTQDINSINHDLLQYFKNHEKEFNVLKQKQEKKVSDIDSNQKKIRKEVLQFKKKILDIIDDEILQEEKILKQLQQEKIKQEQLFNLIKEKDDSTKLEKQLEQKEKKLEFTVKNLKLDERLYKAKISTLKTNLKSKKYKTIEPISFILTLGVIYWTSYSDTKSVILRYETKINKLKEKEILLEKELEEVHEKKRIMKEKNLEKLKEITKEEDSLQKKIHELEKQFDKQKKTIEKKYEQRKKKEQEYEKLVEQETALSNTYISEYEKLKKIQEVSLEELEKDIKQAKIKKENKKKELEELLQTLQKQSINSKKNYSIKLS